jgi:hypothetical protein
MSCKKALFTWLMHPTLRRFARVAKQSRNTPEFLLAGAALGVGSVA